MIVGISGKKHHGKDLVAKIIQYLVFKASCLKTVNWTWEEFIASINNIDAEMVSGFKKVMMSTKLKQCVCLILGCTMEQLEDNAFKEKELEEEWRVWFWTHYKYPTKNGRISRLFSSKEEAELDKSSNEEFYNYFGTGLRLESKLLTPRKLLQLLGTDAGRGLIHPNLWLNAYIVDYKTRHIFIHHDNVHYLGDAKCGICRKDTQGIEYFLCDEHTELSKNNFPNWITPDIRFENEINLIRKYKGLIFRINRVIKPTLEDCKDNKVQIARGFLDGTVKSQKEFDSALWEDYTFIKGDEPYLERALEGRNSMTGRSGIRLKQDTHESETSLDNYDKFDAVFTNDGTVEDLIEQVRQTLIKYELITE